MKKFLMVMAVCVIGASVFFTGCAGCTEEKVPVGYVGMIKKPGGLTGELLNPGSHDCWGRDELKLIATTEAAYKEKMQIRCADKLNTKAFDLIVRGAPKVKTGDDFKKILRNQGTQMRELTKTNGSSVQLLNAHVLYGVYVSGMARNVTRLIVSKYKSDEIVENRAAIQKKINAELRNALKGVPFELKVALVNNLDPPDVITRAVENARSRDLAIKQEEANQRIELLKAKNRRELAQEEKLTLVKEAEAEAAYMQIIGESLTKGFLERRRLKVKEKEIAAKEFGYKKASSITMIDGNAVPLVGTK